MEHQFHTETLINNVFTFENPDQLDSRVWHYAAGHSEMGIQLFDNDKGVTYYLDFIMVHYFSGPLKWQGANFQLHPWNESILLMKELNLLQNLEDAPDEIRKLVVGSHYKLYTVSAINPKVKIKILSAGGHLRETNI